MQFLPQLAWLVSPAVLCLLPLAYLGGAWIGHRAMESRAAPPFVRTAMQVYNVAQILLCLYMTWGLSPVFSLPNIFGVGSAYTEAGEWFMLVHYLSKYMDWLDTLWMILNKKSHEQMSFLHLYHHSTIVVVWGVVLHLGHGNGTVRFGAFINSFTHVLMYSHYLWTSFGRKNPFRQLVTTWQIVQFYFCFAHSCCVLFLFHHLECCLPWSLAWLQFCYQLSMLYLFKFRMRWVPQCIKQTRGGSGPAAEKSEDSGRPWCIKESHNGRVVVEKVESVRPACSKEVHGGRTAEKKPDHGRPGSFKWSSRS